MKEWGIVALLLAIASSICWARASVSHVTPENANQQRLAIVVEATSVSNGVDFAISISAKTNAPLPARFSASVRVEKPNVTFEQINLTETKGDQFVRYTFSVLKSDLAGATFFFWLPPRTDTPMPPMGHRDGSYYHIDLLPFVRTEKVRNQVPENIVTNAPNSKH
jgi:hypothetical protein